MANRVCHTHTHKIVIFTRLYKRYEPNLQYHKDYHTNQGCLRRWKWSQDTPNAISNRAVSVTLSAAVNHRVRLPWVTSRQVGCPTQPAPSQFPKKNTNFDFLVKISFTFLHSWFSLNIKLHVSMRKTNANFNHSPWDAGIEVHENVKHWQMLGPSQAEVICRSGGKMHYGFRLLSSSLITKNKTNQRENIQISALRQGEPTCPMTQRAPVSPTTE
jgi:hypothetical protein